MILVGTSGWQYTDWRGPFYPASLPRRRWLEHFAAEFPTVEVNNAFYRLPERGVFASWRERTPPGFVIAVKMSRYLTHIRRLREPAEPVARFLDRAAGLGDRLGPVLLQLPPTLPADGGLLARTLGLFPASVRVVVEPRHASWWSEPGIRTVLAEHRAALCWADRRGRPQGPLWRTAGFGYVRLHEGRAAPRPRYGRRALVAWLDRIEASFGPGDEVFVYFNNDPGAAAIADARAFLALATARGHPVPVVTGAGCPRVDAV